MLTFMNRLKASSWIIKLRFSFFLLSIAFFLLMSFFSILYCKPSNLKFLIPSLLLLLVIKCLFFLYFSVKIGGIESTFKGPVMLPGTLFCVLPLAFMVMPVLVYEAGSRTIPGLFLTIVFVPIVGLFKFAAALDTSQIATQGAVGATMGLCFVRINQHEERLAYIPAALTVLVAFFFIWLNNYLQKKLNQAASLQISRSTT